MHFINKLILIVLASVFMASAHAHDVWLVPHDGKDLQLVFGHPGNLEPYDPGKVVAMKAIAHDGKSQDPASRVDDNHLIVTPASDTVLIAIDYDHGIWTATADGEMVNKPRGEVAGARSSAREQMYSKALLDWSETAGKPVGTRFEIVPLVDPFALNPGDDLPVQLLYDSRPLAGAEIEMLGVFDLFFTDSDGKANLPLPDEDFQYILAMHRIPLGDNPDTDELKLQANLTFSR